MIRTANPLTGSDANTRSHPDLDEFCRRHGFDPNVVFSAEYDVIDAPLLRFTIYQVNEAGNKYAVQDAEGHWHPVTQVIERPLIGDLPWWWQVTSQS